MEKNTAARYKSLALLIIGLLVIIFGVTWNIWFFIPFGVLFAVYGIYYLKRFSSHKAFVI